MRGQGEDNECRDLFAFTSDPSPLTPHPSSLLCCSQFILTTAIAFASEHVE
jgi:hypothetical protein